MIENSPWKLIFKYVKRFKWFGLISIVTTILADVLSKYAVLYSSRAIDLISKYNDKERSLIKEQAIILIFIFCSIYLIKNLTIFINKYIEAHIVPRFSAEIRKDFFTTVHKKPISFFNDNMSGEISSTGQNMIMGVEAILWEFLASIFPFIVNMTVTIIFIYSSNKEIAYITLAISILYIILMFLLGKNKTKYSKVFRKAYSRVSGIITDSVSNAETVKNNSNINHETENFSKENNKLREIYTKHRSKNNHVVFAQNLGNFAITLILWFVSLDYWLNNKISSVDFIFITGLIATSLSTLTFIVYAITGAMNSLGNIRNGLELLSSSNDLIDGKDELKISKGELEVKEIDFQYNGKKSNVFDKLNLKINSKEKVGIVGKSGSGKSTLIKLLLRYFDTKSGDIIIDGQKIKEITQESLHENIAIIPQEASLFNRSIMDNIRYGKVDASDDEVIESAKKAYAHDFIMETPNGYDSIVGEKGIKLSGGERQRIAIARAILRNSPILILDEATSALDSESEIYIQKSMTELMKDKTVIVIAHRLSTLKDMDRLVIMDKGEVKEEGSHKSLLQEKGIYHKLYSMQADGFIGIENGV